MNRNQQHSNNGSDGNGGSECNCECKIGREDEFKWDGARKKFEWCWLKLRNAATMKEFDQHLETMMHKDLPECGEAVDLHEMKKESKQQHRK